MTEHYSTLSFDESVLRVRVVSNSVKQADPDHPVVTIYGELPSKELIDSMPEIDAWGLNVYRGIGFGDLFTDWRDRSIKPMFLGEFGADAWNALTGFEDQAAQAEATLRLIQELRANSSITAGGVIFEWNDEWWKDADGDPSVHDTGGVAPGGGPHPDATFNEEWWGIVDIDRNPRQAYRAVKNEWGPGSR